MPRIPVKLLLVSLLCIEVVLWSRSRQATGKLDPSLSSEIRLWTRSLPEYIIHSMDKGTCAPRTLPIDEQCHHVKSNCPSSQTLVGVTYVQKYFCSPPQLRTSYFLALTLWLVFLFSTLGISASDFFCPNLASIAGILGLDENVAGVTFLALGNGSPDVFSTFSAMKAHSGGLAIGELIGAASFIVSVVVGSMALIKPFQVNRGPFLRDVGFFTVAIGLLLYVLIDGIITAWEAGLLVLLYVVYVAVVIVFSWREKRNEQLRRKDSLLRSQYAEGDDETLAITTPYHDNPEEAYRDDETEDTLSASPTSPTSPFGRLRAHSNPSVPHHDSNGNSQHLSLSIPSLGSTSPPHSRRRANSGLQLPSYSLLGALEFRTAVNLLRQHSTTNLNQFENSPITPYAAGHYPPLMSGHSHSRSLSHSHSRPVSGHEEADGEPNPWESSLEAVPLDERPGLLESGHSHSSLHPNSRLPRSPSRLSTQSEEQEGSPTASLLSAIPEINIRLPSKRQKAKNAFIRALHVLFPTLHHFTEKSVLGMIAALFAVPAVLALTLTLPVVVTPRGESDEEEKGPKVDVPESNVPQLGNLINFEEEGVERPLLPVEEVEEELEELNFNKWLMAAQCVLGPMFCASVLFGSNSHFMLILALTAIAGAVTGALVAVFANEGNDPAARVARAGMGFFVAIVWIMAIADEVVQVLQTFGLIFGLSDAIIGLTIFAVGNSLADFVANITVAAFAPIMGFSACFGGPMLNILLGVGLSGTYLIREWEEPYRIHLNTTLLVSTLGLLALLTATLIVVPLNGYWINRVWAGFLICAYVAIMVTNVVVEVKAGESGKHA